MPESEFVGQSLVGDLHIGDTVMVGVGQGAYAAQVQGVAAAGTGYGLRIMPEGAEKTRVISFHFVSQIIDSPVRRRLKWQAKPECRKCKFWATDKPDYVESTGDCRRYPARVRKASDDWCGEYIFKQPESKAD